MSGIGFKNSVDLKNGEGFCGRPKEEGFREQSEMHRHCYNDGFTGVYELAQKYGFTGTEQEFLASLKGVKGDGVYVDHIDQSDEAGEVSIIWFTDGSSMRLINGIPGAKGDKGDRGEQGLQGIQGERGETGPQGLQGPQGERGLQGIQGATGKQGPKGDQGDRGPQGLQGPQGDPGQNGLDGYSPVKGVDYFTAADKAEILQDVIDALPVYDGEAVIT